MKFSVVTPSFDQGRFIRDCIESVRAQDETDCEHLIVDAGSTDGTLDIIRQYPHLRWTSEPDRGMSDAINKGFLRARGEWVMWLNTDDYLLPCAFKKVSEHAKLHPGADIIYGECLDVDESKRVLRRRRDHQFDRNVLLFYGCYIQSTSTFIRRRVLESGNLLDLRYKNCMDFEYYLRLSRLGYRFSFLPEALAGFRWHGANTSTHFSERRYRERVEIQQNDLQAAGRGYLSSPWVLSVLQRVYQLKRVLLRAWTRHG